MGKPTKRERKFRASGGVQGRLRKGGSMATKGKIRTRRNDDHRPVQQQQQQQQQGRHTRGPLSPEGRAAATTSSRDRHRREPDILGSENLGQLDIDDFFQEVVKSAERDEGAISEAEDDDDDDDNDDDLNEDEFIPPPTKGSSQKALKTRNDEDEEEDENDDQDPPLENDVQDSDVDGDDQSAKSSGESSTNSSEDEDDLEAAEARMKEEMVRMEQSDPEFHDFLKKNEASLLEFGDGVDDSNYHNDDDDDDDDDDSEGLDDVEADGQNVQADVATNDVSHVELTPKLLKSLHSSAFRAHSIKSLRKIVAAYRAACHMAYSAADGGKGGYSISSSDVFERLVVVCLGNCRGEFRHHLLKHTNDAKPEGEGTEKDHDADDADDTGNDGDDDDDNKPLNPKIMEKSDRWKDLKGIMSSFFRSTLHLITEAKHPKMLAFLLKSLSKYLRYLSAFPRIAEAMLKSLTVLWSAPQDTAEDYQVVRLNAFLRIRQLALTQPFPFIEHCLKKTYLAYARRSKFGTGSSVASVLPTLTFMGNCLVELYSLDHQSSYQHAFVYIRQLALLLRAALQQQTDEARQQVYCWQYLHCLKLWAVVLASTVAATADEYSDKDAASTSSSSMMRSLIYPLTEVIMGAIRSAPSPIRLLPFRLHCVRLLQQLAASSETFIPSTSILLDCWDWKEWYLPPKKAKSSSGKSSRSSSSPARGVQIQWMIRLGKDDTLRTHEQLEACNQEIFLLLNREVDLYRYSAGFPEYSILIVQRLNRFAKEVRNPRWRAMARACREVCDRHAAWAVQARSKLREAPKDIQRLECLRPMSENNMLKRYNESIEQETRALEATMSRSNATSTVGQLAGPANEMDDKELQLEEKSTRKRKNTKKKEEEAKKKVKINQDNPRQSKDIESVDEADIVADGIDWSDDDDDDEADN